MHYTKNVLRNSNKQKNLKSIDRISIVNQLDIISSNSAYTASLPLYYIDYRMFVQWQKEIQVRARSHT